MILYICKRRLPVLAPSSLRKSSTYFFAKRQVAVSSAGNYSITGLSSGYRPGNHTGSGHCLHPLGQFDFWHSAIAPEVWLFMLPFALGMLLLEELRKAVVVKLV